MTEMHVNSPADPTPDPDASDDVAGHLYIPPGERSGTTPDAQGHGGPKPASDRDDA